MTLSVIIPTKNRKKELINTLETVLQQSLLPEEIIIVDQNETEEVKNEIISLFNKSEIKSSINMEYIHDPGITGLTQARNRGIDANESDAILFLDDDVLLEREFIFHIMEIFRKYPDVYGVSGIITNATSGLIGKFYHKVFCLGPFRDPRPLINTSTRLQSKEVIFVSKLPGGLTSYKKKVFDNFKFDENLVGYGLSEDFDFSFRVSQKYKLAITPKARLIHLETTAGKFPIDNNYKNAVLAMNYFYNKNLSKNFINLFYYWWLNMGFVFKGLLCLILKRRADEIRGYTMGLKALIRHQSWDYLINKRKPSR